MPLSLTPLAIAVMSLLSRGPLHPYEMRQRIRVQHIDQVMKVTQGTLYSTVERLAEAGLITPVETSREGRRPERTVYAITDAGRDQMLDALRGTLLRPSPEYRRLAMALSFVSALEPAEVAELLEHRSVEVEAKLSGLNTTLDAALKHGLPRVHMIETEYLAALERAELDWLRAAVEDIRDGRITWPASPAGPERHADPAPQPSENKNSSGRTERG
ncbi:MAG TPA: helix-turn-helix transcriptional regulator [Streptosporangiaceae bacterium]|jgi:DNA-binding PadR family transcriptional regulator|nr:helix-turn-helix transcriptional regulator [Streptosporangiaceae bacterium]